MGKLMDATIENLLDALLSGAALDTTATWDVGLSSTAPADDGTNITEPVGASYDRVTTNADTTDWPLAVAGSRTKSNGVAITFPEALENWGVMTHFVLFDDGGVARAWGLLDTAYDIVIGVLPSFAPGTLIVTGPGS